MPGGTWQRERQVDRLRVCNSFRELVRIAKEWVNTYAEMPVSVRRLFKHTHLNTACRLLGVSSLSLEFLPERDASLAEGENDAEGSEASKGWTGAGAKKPMAEDIEAARKSHAAQSGADASSGGAAGETAAASAGASGTVNGHQGKAGTPPQQVVEVGDGANKVGGARGQAAPGKPEKLVPFAVMTGPEVEQERWEV